MSNHHSKQHHVEHQKKSEPEVKKLSAEEEEMLRTAQALEKNDRPTEVFQGRVDPDDLPPARQ